MAFHRLSPIGEVRHDLQAGAVAAMIGNVMGGGKKSKKPWSPSDFVFDAKPEEDSDEGSDRLTAGRALYERKKRQEQQRKAGRSGEG